LLKVIKFSKHSNLPFVLVKISLFSLLFKLITKNYLISSFTLFQYKKIENKYIFIV